jgi:hypothetical protein
MYLELILIKEGSIVTLRPKIDIMTFNKGEEFKTALNLNIGYSLSPSYILYPFLLYINLGEA